MAAALTLLLIGCLLQDALSGEFWVNIPQTISALRGSCVTIPCSFDVRDDHENNLDDTCKAVWKKDRNNVVFHSGDSLQSTIKGQLTGDLKRKDCTTTLNNMQPKHSGTYFFRLECDNSLKWDFRYEWMSISVSDDPPTPTLSQSTLWVEEGTSVSLSCSAPASCLSPPPTLTWTPHLSDIQETLQEKPDKTKVKISSVTFTASHLHHRQEISCTAIYTKQDGSTESSTSSLTADIQYSPKNTTVSVRPSGPVPEDSRVSLTCSSSANPAVWSYTWYRVDGGWETFIRTGQVLNIKAVKGPFFCRTQNDLGVGQSSNRLIDVQYAPKHTTVSVSPSGPVPEHNIVTLTCNSSANPAVKTYTWYRADGGQETIGTGQVLNIKASEISRPFFCKAENDLGEKQSSINRIDVQYSPKHTTVSVSPSGPVREDSNVTLTCSSSANPAVKTYTWYRADGGQDTFLKTGQVLNIRASKVSKLFFCEAENVLGAGRSNITLIDVQFAPQILSSSECTKAADQLNCSCETVGNPSPTLQWYLDGSPVNHSDKFAISSESLNNSVRDIITVNQPQERSLSTLLCRSSNSLGSADQRFHFYFFETQTPAESHGHVMLTALITGVVVLLVLVCALLLVIRAKRIRHNLRNSAVAMSQLEPSPERNEVPDKAEEDVYANANVQKQAGVAPPTAISELNNAEAASRSTEKSNAEGCDVLYASVTYKTKKKQAKDTVDMDQSGNSYLEEERCMVGGMGRNFVSNALEMGNLYDEVEPSNAKKEVECEYAQVKFKSRKAMQK